MIPKWQPKYISQENPTPTVLTVLTNVLEGKKPDIITLEIEIEESEKQIKLLLRPGELKARIEHFRKKGRREVFDPYTTRILDQLPA